MIFRPMKLCGVYRIEIERQEDERGFFARTWCEKEFSVHGSPPRWVQCSISFNPSRNTLRGLHYQASPHEEEKLVRCTRGAIYDVLLDLRPGSATFKQWDSTELTADRHTMHYIPAGVAHGFQTLEDNTEVFYQISQLYHPESARGVRWDDPAFHIHWPPGPRIISTRDQQYRDYVS